MVCADLPHEPQGQTHTTPKNAYNQRRTRQTRVSEGKDRMDRDEIERRLRERLRRTEPAPWKGKGPGGDLSALRLHIRATFPDLEDARARGVTWQQLADAINAEGVPDAPGETVEWRRLKSLHHAERYSRGGKRRKRPKKAAAGRGAPAAAALPPDPPRASPAHPAGPGAVGSAQRAAAATAKLRAEMNVRSGRPADHGALDEDGAVPAYIPPARLFGLSCADDEEFGPLSTGPLPPRGEDEEDTLGMGSRLRRLGNAPDVGDAGQEDEPEEPVGLGPPARPRQRPWGRKPEGGEG